MGSVSVVPWLVTCVRAQLVSEVSRASALASEPGCPAALCTLSEEQAGAGTRHLPALHSLAELWYHGNQHVRVGGGVVSSQKRVYLLPL